MHRRISLLVVLLVVLGVVVGLMPAREARAVTSCSPACGPHEFCCINCTGQGVCVPDVCPLACPAPCCLDNCRWTCCA